MIPVLPTKTHGNMSLFDTKDALQVLNYCEANGVSIFGIEGFHLTENKIVPDMDYIADFSIAIEQEGDDFQKKSLEWSRSFMNEIFDKNIFLEFTLAEL
jgi:hypothetical protein